MTDYSDLLRIAISQGHPVDVTLTALREREATLIDSVKAVREVLGLSLAEAKNLVTASPAWTDRCEPHAKFVNQETQKSPANRGF